MPRNVDIYQRQGNELAQPYVQQGFQNAGYQSQTDQTNRANWMKDMFEEQNKLKMAAFQGGQYVDDVDAAGRAIKIWKPFDDIQKLYLRDEINKISRAMPTYTDAEGKTFYATSPIGKSAVNVNWADRQRLMGVGNEVRNTYLNQGIDPEKQISGSMKGALDNILQKQTNGQNLNTNDFMLDKDAMLMVGNSYDQWERNNTNFINQALSEYADLIQQPTAQELRDYKTMLFLNTQPGLLEIGNLNNDYKRHVINVINTNLDFLDRAAYSGNAPNLFGEYLGTINQTYPATEYYKYNSMGGMKLPEGNYPPWNYGEQNTVNRSAHTLPYQEVVNVNPQVVPGNQSPGYNFPGVNTQPNIWESWPFNTNPMWDNMPKGGPGPNVNPQVVPGNQSPGNQSPGYNSSGVNTQPNIWESWPFNTNPMWNNMPKAGSGPIVSNFNNPYYQNNVQPNRYNWPFLNNNMA